MEERTRPAPELQADNDEKGVGQEKVNIKLTKSITRHQYGAKIRFI
jgi:hypothetical protein